MSHDYKEGTRARIWFSPEITASTKYTAIRSRHFEVGLILLSRSVNVAKVIRPCAALCDDGVIEGCGMAAAFSAAATHPSQSIYSQSRQGASINDVRNFWSY